MKTKANVNKTVTLVNFDASTVVDIDNTAMYNAIKSRCIMYATNVESPEGSLITDLTNEPNSVMFRKCDSEYFIEHNGIFIPSRVSIQKLIDAGVSVGLFCQLKKQPGSTPIRELGESRTHNLDGTPRTDSDRVDYLNCLLLSTFEESYFENVAAVLDSDVIREGTDWCSPEAWESEVDILAYREMVDFMCDAEGEIIFNLGAGRFELEA